MPGTELHESPYQRLADATTHEVRNALNAMAIHLAVLADRMAGADGTPAKSVAVLQSQVGRIETIMRRFQRLASPPPEEGDAELSELVAQVVEACGHDARRHAVAVEVELRPVSVRGRIAGLTEAVLAAILEGIALHQGHPMKIALSAQGREAVLSITGPAADGAAGAVGTAAAIELRLPLAG